MKTVTRLIAWDVGFSRFTYLIENVKTFSQTKFQDLQTFEVEVHFHITIGLRYFRCPLLSNVTPMRLWAVNDVSIFGSITITTFIATTHFLLLAHVHEHNLPEQQFWQL